jgi:hypothetical protein
MYKDALLELMNLSLWSNIGGSVNRIVTHTLFMYKDDLLELMNVSLWSNIGREWEQNNHTYTVYV